MVYKPSVQKMPSYSGLLTDPPMESAKEINALLSECVNPLTPSPHSSLLLANKLIDVLQESIKWLQHGNRLPCPDIQVYTEREITFWVLLLLWNHWKYYYFMKKNARKCFNIYYGGPAHTQKCAGVVMVTANKYAHTKSLCCHGNNELISCNGHRELELFDDQTTECTVSYMGSKT